MRSLIITSILFTASTAIAHPTVSNGAATANKGSQLIKFGLGHGCDGADTIALRIDIPAGVTSVRGLPSDFGNATYTKSGTAVTSVTWRKTDADLQAEDNSFYEFTIRARIADVPFTRIQFNITQTCKLPGGAEVVVLWDQPPESTTGEPAAMLTVLPARIAGWNRFTVPATIPEADYGIWFSDAQIVWAGTKAFSSNAITMTQIGATQGVTALTGDIAAGTELLVKY
jgi:periplasmic copper chaperone A